MSATLVYVGIGSLLAVGVATLTVAVLCLRTARRYVQLAEERLELLREGEALLLKVARQQGHASEESQEPERRAKVPEIVGHRTGEEPRVSGLREEPDRHARETPDIREHSSPAEDAAEHGREATQEEEASVQGTAASRPRDGAPLLGIRVSHPDDDVILRGWNSSPARFFQKCYDRYLEHYEGYVRLAERIHRMREEAGVSPATVGWREWEDKLRRAYDAIERTTQRLDMLEEHYPELATDSDRISSRIGTARLHAGLAERFGRSR